jgi:hypothetical protein
MLAHSDEDIEAWTPTPASRQIAFTVDMAF